MKEKKTQRERERERERERIKRIGETDRQTKQDNCFFMPSKLSKKL